MVVPQVSQAGLDPVGTSQPLHQSRKTERLTVMFVTIGVAVKSITEAASFDIFFMPENLSPSFRNSWASSTTKIAAFAENIVERYCDGMEEAAKSLAIACRSSKCRKESALFPVGKC